MVLRVSGLPSPWTDVHMDGCMYGCVCTHWVRDRRGYWSLWVPWRTHHPFATLPIRRHTNMQEGYIYSLRKTDWESDTFTHHGDAARHIWRQAVAEIADKAKATLPQCNGRVEKAVAIVLNGDVELLPEGKARGASQSNGTTKYFVVNGECSCPDYPKAPQGFCKHRLAYGIHKRAYTLAKQRLAKLDSAQDSTSAPPTEQPQVQPQAEPVSTLPEAPASVNVHVMLAGRQVQVTLRDSDEQRLLARLEALLKRFPVEEEPAQAQPEGWCS